MSVTDWGPGAVHMYWTGYKGADLTPRWCLRPDMLKAIAGEGVQVGARRTSYGAEVEFKLPWRNFPEFKPAAGAVIALDCVNATKDYVQGRALVLAGAVIDPAALANTEVPLKEMLPA